MLGDKYYISKSPITNAFVLLLAGVMLIGAALILPAAWQAAKEFAKSEAAHDPHGCFAIQNDVGRLSCFEKRVDETPPPPARGANAPANLFGSSSRSRD